MTTSSTPGTPPRRVKKRVLVPAVLLGLSLFFLAFLYVRGNNVLESEKDPDGPSAGPVTQLYRAPDGNVYVRCALVIDAPPKDVWAVVTDFDHQAEFLPYVSRLSAEREDGGRYHLTGVAHSRLWGDWPFDSHVTLKEQPDRGEYRASWSEEDVDGFAVNRGSWTLRPSGDGGTLVAYALQAELPHYPNFLVRNVIMDRLHKVLVAVRDEVHRRGRQQ